MSDFGPARGPHPALCATDPAQSPWGRPGSSAGSAPLIALRRLTRSAASPSPAGLCRRQGPPHRRRLVLDDDHVRTHRGFRFASTLLPFLNGPHLQPVAFRKLVAREALPIPDYTNVYVGNPALFLHGKFDFA